MDVHASVHTQDALQDHAAALCLCALGRARLVRNARVCEQETDIQTRYVYCRSTAASLVREHNNYSSCPSLEFSVKMRLVTTYCDT